MNNCKYCGEEITLLSEDAIAYCTACEVVLEGEVEMPRKNDHSN